MQEWQRISLVLCTFGFLKELRPIDPFIVNFLSASWRNVSLEEIIREVIPVVIYTQLSCLVIVFLITDYFRYKPLIIISGISGIIVWGTLSWAKSLSMLKFAESFYGIYLATEIAYYTYIYAKVDRVHYQKVTSQTRASISIGRFGAASISQIMVYFELMSFEQLNYWALTSQIVATIWAFFLPSVKSSIYFHQYDKNNDNFYRKLKHATKLIWHHFKQAFTNKTVLLWSLWYSMGMCGFAQVNAFIQALWDYKNESENVILWNGAVEAVVTLLGAVAALCAGYLQSGFLKKTKNSLMTLFVLSILEGCGILVTSHMGLSISYFGYMFYCVLYAFTITIVSSEIAENVSDDSFGLVFGVNTLVALIIQCILTFTIVDEHGFALTVAQQFTVYGYFYIVLAFVYLIFYIISWTCNAVDAVPDEDNYL